MKTKILLLLLTVITTPIFLNAQIKVTSDGKIGFGTPNPDAGSMITIGKDSLKNALIFYEVSKGGVSLRLFRDNNYAYIIRGGNTNNGITMSPYGKVTFKFTEGNTAGGVTEAVVNYSTQTAWNLYYNNSRNFYVQGNGDVWHCGFIQFPMNDLNQILRNSTNKRPS